ncbi:protein BPS1, chloroplastic-like [Musa acuminata AAA Group]|uniref:protein BPS1, chloroplastic-like n=1 Tax=Musa acuminata AAA Group TaxID=214697 RepID=UPI0031D73B90
MEGSALPCLRCQGLSSTPLTEDASTFCTSLTEDLKGLELSLAKDSISLRWFVEAMSVLKRMQVRLLALLKKSELPISCEAEDWFDQYMQESASLLDFCNSMKSALSGINRSRMALELAVHKLSEDNEFGLERLQKAHEEILDFSIEKERLGLAKGGILLGGNGSDDKNMAIVMFAAKTTVTVLSWFMISAMISPVPVNVEDKELTSSIPELQQCMEMLTELTGSFDKRISSLGIGREVALVEHEMVNEAVEELQAAEKNSHSFLSGLEKLRTRSFELKEGIERLGTVVDEVFEEAIRGRNEMLDIFRNATL